MTSHDPLLHAADALPWFHVGPGFDLKHLHGETDEDVRVVLLRLEPGTVITRHRHRGEVHAFNLAGTRKLLETGELVGPGGYVYEPPGNEDSWMAVGDEPVVVFVTVHGAMEELDEEGRITSLTTTSSSAARYRRFREGGTP